jgi:hypothetical protein
VRSRVMSRECLELLVPNQAPALIEIYGFLSILADCFESLAACLLNSVKSSRRTAIPGPGKTATPCPLVGKSDPPARVGRPPLFLD